MKRNARTLAARRRAREQGSALIVAIVMLVVMISMIELMLAAPNAELMKVRSTSAKEASNASADAGIKDAVNYLMANNSTLSTLFTDPHAVTGGTGASGTDTFVATQKTANSNVGGPTQVTVSAELGSSFVALEGTDSTRPKLYKFYNFTDSTDFVRFGDTVLSHGEYAYRIWSLGNEFYQVDVEGRAIGLSQGASGSTPKFVTRITAVLSVATTQAQSPAALTFSNPNGGSINNAAGGTNNWKRVDSSGNTISGQSTPQIYDMATGGGSDKVANASPITGTDATSGGTATSSIGFYNLGMTFTADNTSSTIPQGSTSASPPETTVYSFIDTLVNKARDTSPSSTLMKYKAGYTTSTPPGSGTYNTPGNKDLNNTAGNGGITYFSIGADTPVTSSLVDINNQTPSGIVIFDVQNGATFNASELWLKHGNSGDNFKGAVIFYMRGSITIPQTGLLFMHGDGSSPPAIQWDSTSWKKAINGLIPPVPTIVSYTVVQ